MTTDTTQRPSQHHIGPDGLLVVRLHVGEIRLRGTDGDTVTVRSMDGSGLDGLDVEPGERSLSIRARRGPDFHGHGRRARRTTELDLDVPAGATIVVEGPAPMSKPRVLHGDQRYRTASGDLVLATSSGSSRSTPSRGDMDILANGRRDDDRPDRVRRPGRTGRLARALRATTTSGDLLHRRPFDGEGPYAIVDRQRRPRPRSGQRRSRGGRHDHRRHRPDDAGARREEAGGRLALRSSGSGGPTITFRSTSGDLRLVAGDGVADRLGSNRRLRRRRPPRPSRRPHRWRPRHRTDRRQCRHPPRRRANHPTTTTRRSPPRDPAGPRARRDRRRRGRAAPREPRIDGSAPPRPRPCPMTDALESVLRLVAEGRLTAEEAGPILDALETRTDTPPPQAPAVRAATVPRLPRYGPGRAIRLEVTERAEGRQPAVPLPSGVPRSTGYPALRGHYRPHPRSDRSGHHRPDRRRRRGPATASASSSNNEETHTMTYNDQPSSPPRT